MWIINDMILRGTIVPGETTNILLTVHMLHTRWMAVEGDGGSKTRPKRARIGGLR